MKNCKKLLLLVLALCLALVGSFANMTFLGVVIANTIIGTVQQLRSKRTVDQLTLVAAHKVRCLRDGKSILLPSEELVRDDIVEFTSGEQICADAVVCTGSAQANEALITGEAEPVRFLILAVSGPFRWGESGAPDTLL